MTKKRRKTAAKHLRCKDCNQVLQREPGLTDTDVIDIHVGQDCDKSYALAFQDAHSDVPVTDTPEPTPEPEEVKVEVTDVHPDATNTCDECGFIAKSVSGLLSHLRKHKREANDPAKADIGTLKAMLREMASTAMQSAADAHEEAKEDTNTFVEIVSLEEEIANIKDEVLPLLLAVPEEYQDASLIRNVQATLAAAMNNLAVLKSDPHYRRGKSAHAVVERRGALAELQDEASAKNDEIRNSYSRSSSRVVLERLLSGNLLIPSNKFGQEPLCKNLWYRVNNALKKEDVKGAERTFEAMSFFIETICEAVLPEYINFAEETPSFHTYFVDEEAMAITHTGGPVEEVFIDGLTWNDAIREVTAMLQYIYGQMPRVGWSFGKAARRYIDDSATEVALRVGSFAAESPGDLESTSETWMQYKMKMALGGHKKGAEGDPLAEEVKDASRGKS